MSSEVSGQRDCVASVTNVITNVCNGHRRTPGARPRARAQSCAPMSAASAMIVEGYVRKNHAGQDFSRTNHRRYFVAEGFRVFYYTDAKKTSVKGHFDLRNVIQIRPYGGASSKVGPGAIVVQIAEPNYAGPHKNMVISFLDKRAAWLTLFCSATVPDYVEESLRQYVDKGLAESLNARYGAAEAVSAYRSVFERFLTRRTPTVAVLTPRIGQKGGVSVPQALPQPIPQPADADLDSPRGAPSVADHLLSFAGIAHHDGSRVVSLMSLFAGFTLPAMLVLFVVSGVMQPLLITTLGYNGAYDKSTLLFLLPNYVGMSLAGLLRRNVFSQGTFRWQRLSVLCAVDVVSQLLCQYGLAVAGSSLYSIIYSSTTIWIAIESRFIIRRRLAAAQWAGCAVVVVGLAVAGGDLGTTLTDFGNVEIAMGALMILVGSVSHALTWVLVEMLLHEEDPVLPEAVSALMGFAGVTVFGLWQLVYTLPRADALVFDVIAEHGGDTGVIWTSYVALTLASLVHAVTFYHLVGGIGCVTAGVMKGCQATAVFVFSHMFFCAAHASQCFSIGKAWSLVLVVAGTATYVISTGNAKQQEEEKPDPDSDYHRV